MQLESGGMLFLLCATSYWLHGQAAVPKLWRREGIDFDIGPKNLGDRGFDDNLKHPVSDNEQLRLVKEAYRWLRELDERTSKISMNSNTIQTEVRSESEEIDHLAQQVEQNTQEIQQLQSAICSLWQTMCKEKSRSCGLCPWATTKPPPTNAPGLNNATRPSPITAKPSPNPDGSCGPPEIPDNGYAEKNSTTLNTLLVLHCNAGYDLIGNDRMICTAIWNDMGHKYQYSWAPPMSAICKANGKPTPTKAAVAPTRLTSAQKAAASSKKSKTPIKREYEDAIESKIPSECSEPKRVGVCKAAIPRFFFNQDSQICERFLYGGCHGNKNNFVTEKECLCRCKKCP